MIDANLSRNEILQEDGHGYGQSTGSAFADCRKGLIESLVDYSFFTEGMTLRDCLDYWASFASDIDREHVEDALKADLHWILQEAGAIRAQRHADTFAGRFWERGAA